MHWIFKYTSTSHWKDDETTLKRPRKDTEKTSKSQKQTFERDWFSGLLHLQQQDSTRRGIEVSWRVMLPERSVSKARQAPATSPLRARTKHAKSSPVHARIVCSRRWVLCFARYTVPPTLVYNTDVQPGPHLWSSLSGTRIGTPAMCTYKLALVSDWKNRLLIFSLLEKTAGTSGEPVGVVFIKGQSPSFPWPDRLHFVTAAPRCGMPWLKRGTTAWG